jgi:hypothetical protein
MGRLFAFATALLVVGAACATPSAFGTVPTSTTSPPALELSLSPSEVLIGETFEATVTGCTPGGPVNFTQEGGEGATAECFGGELISSVTVELIAPDAPGEYAVGAVDTATDRQASATLTVTPPSLVLSLSPSTVETGATFTATATGCVRDELVSFSIDGRDGATVDCAGEGSDTSAAVELTAPEAPGTYIVEADNFERSAEATLTVNPRLLALTLSPATVETSGAFTATANGCVAGRLVNFSIEGRVGGSADCVGAGGNTSATVELTAPDAGGTYTVEAFEAIEPERTAEAILTVSLPPLVLTLSPTTVGTGATFTATANGCAAGGLVDFSLEGGGATADCVAGQSGTSATVELTAPDAPGTYLVEATDVDNERSADATLTVTRQPVLSLSPSTVETGAGFTATLEGCTADEPVEFTVEGNSATAACANGAATARLTAPARPGTYTVGALTRTGRRASAPLTVVRPKLDLVLSPSTVDPSETFTAALLHCIGSEQVRFTVDGSDPVTANCDGGEASAALTAPNAPGRYDVEGAVTGTDLNDSAVLTVRVLEFGVELPETRVDVGAPFTVTLRGCIADEEVQFTIEGDSASASCANGSASAELTAPTVPGRYLVGGLATASDRTSSAELFVTGPPEDALVLSQTTVAPGGVFTMTLRGCVPGEQVRFTVEGDSDTAECEETAGGPAGEARWIAQAVNTAADGELTAPTAPGRYLVEAEALTSGLRDTAVITVKGLTGGPTPTTTIPASIPVTL